MNPNKISVIIPTHQRSHLIGNALRSVLAQTVQPLEIIVVDDGSTDDTEDAIQDIAIRCDVTVPVRYIWQENCGASSARNRGICAAQGDYVVFLDSDDTWPIHTMESLARNAGCDVVFGRAENVNEKGNRSEYIHDKATAAKLDNTVTGRLNHPLKHLIEGNFIAVGAVMVRRQAIIDAGLFDLSLRLSEDYDLWLRMASRGCSFGCVNAMLLTRHIHASNAVANKLGLKEATAEVLGRYTPDSPRLDELHYDLGSAYLRRRQWRKAAFHLACVNEKSSPWYLAKLFVSALMAVIEDKIAAPAPTVATS